MRNDAWLLCYATMAACEVPADSGSSNHDACRMFFNQTIQR
jgi:hypothetical protein